MAVEQLSYLEEARASLADALNETLASLGAEAPVTRADILDPTEEGHGDLVSNIALRLARVLHKPPTAIAADLAERFPALPMLDKVEAAGPGFLNFTLNTAWLTGVVSRVLAEGRRYGAGTVGAGRRVLLEFVSANPVGPLVAVNGRAASVGDALGRIMRHAGYRIETEYYVNDGGVQVEKLGQALWLRLQELQGVDVESSWPEGVYPGDYLKDVAKLYRDRYGFPPVRDDAALGRFGAAVFADDHEALLHRFRVDFDHWAHEKDLRASGAPETVVERLTEMGYTYRQDNALWFRSTSFHDDKDRVVVKSNGDFTYVVPDIAYHADKYARGFDLCIDLLGPDHHGYVSRITAAVEAITGRSGALEVLLVQVVHLLRNGERVRMSKRHGDYVPLSDVLDEAGVDAARYFFVERAAETPMDFDLGLAQMSTQANPVYYVQYAGARIRSILRQAGPAARRAADPGRLGEPAERALVLALARFPEVVARSAEERSPHHVPRYLTDLASLFHSFYRQHRVLGEVQELEAARLLLVRSVLTVLELGASLIGVVIPEEM